MSLVCVQRRPVAFGNVFLVHFVVSLLDNTFHLDYLMYTCQDGKRIIYTSEIVE